ncbi:MAG: M23 family metallopeptidase [Pseudomonadota bacterium]
MQKRLVLSGAVAATALLSACDGRVAFPGFSERPDTTESSDRPAPPPDPTDTNVKPVSPPPPSPVVSPPPPAESETPSTDQEDDTTPEPETDQETEAEPVNEDATAPEPEPEPEPLPPPPAPPPTPEPAPPPPPPPPEITTPVAPAFSFHAPGSLLSGSGRGSPDETVFAPDMVFPIKDAPAYPQSQVFNFGGGIGGGDECDARNYEYPWRDNFCESRSRNNSTPSCPVPRVHLGQDIRVGDAAGCNAMRNQYRTNPASIARYKVVAAEDGVISNIGRYTVSVRAGPRIYRYLHMNMRALQVSLGDTVTAGQHIGYVSKDFGGTPTTFHLHFEIKQNTPDGGWEFVPPYTSLVESYARRENAPGERIIENVAVAGSPFVIPEGVEITEGFVSDEYR